MAKAAEAQKSEEAAKPAVALVPRKIDPINHTRMKEEQFLRARYLATANNAHTVPEDLADPAYWAHVAQTLKQRDEVEVWAADGSWRAVVVVLDATKSAARVHLSRVETFAIGDEAMQKVEALSPYRIEHRGPHEQWSVIRKSDDAVVHDGEGTRAGAEFWLRERMKADK